LVAAVSCHFLQPRLVVCGGFEHAALQLLQSHVQPRVLLLHRFHLHRDLLVTIARDLLILVFLQLGLKTLPKRHLLLVFLSAYAQRVRQVFDLTSYSCYSFALDAKSIEIGGFEVEVL